MLTVVSCFYLINNKYKDNYRFWLKNSLKINAPYVFFGTKETIEMAKSIRKNLPTYYIDLEIINFETYKYIDYIVEDHVHCPSRELAMIWLNKLFFIKRAVEINPFNTEQFAWVDAGIYFYRNLHPPLKTFDEEKIKKLPTDRFIFSSSEYKFFIPDLVKDNNLYHYISGNFIISKYLISQVCEIYDEILKDKLPLKNKCYTNDQVFYTIMYHMFGDGMFYKLSDGYGAVINELYTKEENDGESEKKIWGLQKPILYHE
jgi:hypothetical protein